MKRELVRWLWAALLSGVLFACREEPAPDGPLPGGAYGVSVVGFDPASKERAIEGFAQMTGRELEDSRSAVEGLPEVGQLIGFGLTQAEAEWLESRLEGSGLVVQLSIADDPGPGQRARAAGAGVPSGMRALTSD